MPAVIQPTTAQTHEARPLRPSRRRRATALAAAALAATLLAAGCKASADETSSAATPIPIPSVVGMHGDKAKDALQQPDARAAKTVTFQDVHAGESHTRSVLMPSHWKVCSQQPAAGEPSAKDTTVTLSVVKNEEDCPGGAAPAPADPAPAPAPASPTATAPADPVVPSVPAAPPAPAAPAPAAPAPAAPPAPAPTHAPPAPQPAAPSEHQASACTTDSKGNCIVRGRICPNSAHGDTGSDANGRVLTCRDNNGWRWE
ncbi:hypothetical protein ACFU7Z_23730 [Kitasatospora sp. NPDC057518]|uniref:hypothetical protein n=1 Tax=Kitasatospora sp. NPDC057518 TaxID=3346155 RepID=UPI003697A4A2